MGAKPKALKLLQIKERRVNELYSLSPKPYGGGNPYSYCASCHISMIEVSSIGHAALCQYQRLQDEINAIEGQIKYEIALFTFQNGEQSRSFQNYLWQKQDLFVPQLDTFLKRIKGSSNG